MTDVLIIQNGGSRDSLAARNLRQMQETLRRMYDLTSSVIEFTEELPERPLIMTGLRIQELDKQPKE